MQRPTPAPGHDTRQIEFACDVAAGREAAKTLRQFLEERGIGEELLFACELALTEACNNAVHHAEGRPKTPDGEQATTAHGGQLPIQAEATVTKDFVELRVTDHTPGFQWPGRLTLPDPEIPKGRGLFIIQSLMDEADYERGNGANVLRMRKHRAETV